MIKKTILVENKSAITTKNQQLVLKSEIRESTIPIEDIGFLVLDHPEIYLSIPAMNLIVENNTAIIICGSNHLPNGMFLNLNSHHIQQEIFKNQIEASVPLKKQLWQQTIVEKIRNQGELLAKITENKNTFDFLASKVLSGDTSNMEGVAAQQYWKNFPLPNHEIDGIKRERYGDYPNNFLNYGYAILTSYVWQSIINSGLEPYAGVLHTNRPGKPSLVLDIMEEYRAWVVDRNIIKIKSSLKDRKFLDAVIKKRIIEEINKTISKKYLYNKKNLSLQSIMQRQVYKIVGSFMQQTHYKSYIFKW